jgi:hypothetical protein
MAASIYGDSLKLELACPYTTTVTVLSQGGDQYRHHNAGEDELKVAETHYT